MDHRLHALCAVFTFMHLFSVDLESIHNRPTMLPCFGSLDQYLSKLFHVLGAKRAGTVI